MNPTLRVNERGVERWVVGEPAAQTTAIVARPIDVQALATDAMTNNSAMVTAILRSMGPTIDADQRQQAQPGLSSPPELAARNTRFKWVVVAVVVLSAITAAGIVSVAFIGGHVSGPAALAGWLVLSGVAGYLSVTYIHHKEAHLSPESLEGERIKSDYDIASVDAASRQMLAAAYADAVRDDAAARRASAEAQRQANILATAQPAQRAMDYTPRSTPVWMEDTPAPAIVEPCAPVTPTVEPDQVLLRLLATLDDYHAEYKRTGKTLILGRLPWSARGDWDQADKERVKACFDVLIAPPVVARDGGRLHWQRDLPWSIMRQRIIENWR